MSELSEKEIHHHVSVYKRVFFALAFLTLATVGASYLHLPLLYAVGVALAIASLKGSLVAAFFMHLSTERKIIVAILLLTVIFFFVLLITPTIFSIF